MRKQLKSASPSFPSSSSSSDFYPSSLTSHDSLSSVSPLSLPYRPRDHLESLFLKHGYPTPVSLSSCRDLTATSSAYNPPSPSPSPSPRPHHTRLRPRRRSCHRPRYSARRSGSDPPIDAFDSLSLSSSTRPIPIPTRRGSIYEDDLPVTPLTGRFDKDSYFEDWERASISAKSRHFSPPQSSTHRPRGYSRMRSDHSPFISPVGSPVMSPRRPSSPQPSRSHPQNSAKSMPGFHLGNLPRFHPAVYQSSSSGHNGTGQPPSPRQSRHQPNYRPSSSSRDMKWQYRDLLEASHESPEAPRLDPLRSPGPVTPLALEANDYLAAGSSTVDHRVPRESGKQQSGPSPDLIDKLIARENEKARKRKAAFSR
ncbi:hypothetical protein N7450_005231 [Penicillium hetheringtonii]|uniref:Uncharacterized protein n=1 Tax=Penicillium hetheringtonii TaxID=911720 RepID=A0AAD6DRI2_9EURO|nr:hypothetical protein N7450_005231 [Penicillium hetheringtonii]